MYQQSSVACAWCVEEACEISQEDMSHCICQRHTAQCPVVPVFIERLKNELLEQFKRSNTMNHQKGATVRVDKEHDDHDNLQVVVQGSFTHMESGRTIYRVLAKDRKGVEETRHFNEEHLK